MMQLPDPFSYPSSGSPECAGTHTLLLDLILLIRLQLSPLPLSFLVILLHHCHPRSTIRLVPAGRTDERDLH